MKFFKLIIWFLLVLIYAHLLQMETEVSESTSIEVYKRKLLRLSNGNLGKDHIKVGFFTRHRNPRTIGFCAFSVSSFRFRIGLKKQFWDTASEKERILVLAHEYGHCDCLKWEHTENLLKDTCPEHFMYYSLPTKYCIEKHWRLYESQLSQSCDRIRRYR